MFFRDIRFLAWVAAMADYRTTAGSHDRSPSLKNVIAYNINVIYRYHCQKALYKITYFSSVAYVSVSVIYI